MNIAPSYIAAVVSIIAIFFPDIDIDSLNITANTLVLLVSSVVVMVRQLSTGRSSLVGTRPVEEV